MNIGIDARLLERKITGIGRVLMMIINELSNVDKVNKYFLFSYEPLKINNDYFINISTRKSSIPQKIFSPFWINFILPKYLKQNKIDVFFSINQLIPLYKVKRIKYIVVLHDVTHKVDKSFHPFVYRKYLQFFSYFSVMKSDLILTVSKYSKQDILKYYNVQPDKIKVFYPAADKKFQPTKVQQKEIIELKEKIGSSDKLVFYLGMIENRKNIKGILKIADRIYEIDKNIKFLLIGKTGYGGEKLLKDISKRKNLEHLKNIDDDLLNKLYNISTVFLFPSYYEGFGFPPLEAMQSGLPVLASNNTSLKEIINGGGILHNPEDYDLFVNDIIKLSNDTEFRNQIKNRGIERAKRFNITDSTKELVKIFNSFN